MTHTAIGVDVGGTATKAAIVAGSGEVLLRVERRTDKSAGTKGIIAVIDELIGRASEVSAAPSVVGVGAAGFIDATTGSVTFAPNLSYDDPHVAEAVRSRTGLPVIVDNDANAAVWGERTFGAARGLDHVVLLTLGTGIGSGFISNGRLVRGSTGAGAEFGHTVVDPKGPECPCGLRGCIEQFASGGAIGRAARRAAEDNPTSTMIAMAGSVDAITAEHAAKAAREYDEIALEIMHEAGRWLGIALSNIANLFDPQTIVLGGSVAKAGETFLGMARDTLVAMTGAQRRRPLRLDVTELGGDVGIIGAAALAFHEAH
ncbi:MAG: ROK family protein [Actinobacteria bacterium]|nr:ROK family protein [Actinomycetota bacterium]